MEALRLGKEVKSIVQIEKDSEGHALPVVLYEAPQKRKRGSRTLRDADKVIRRLAKTQMESIEAYLRRHDQSNQKRRDGWLRDLPVNVIRASQVGAKWLHPARWMNL